MALKNEEVKQPSKQASGIKGSFATFLRNINKTNERKQSDVAIIAEESPTVISVSSTELNSPKIGD